MPDEIRALIAGLNLDLAKKLSEYLDGDRDSNFLETLNDRIATEDPNYFTVAGDKV